MLKPGNFNEGKGASYTSQYILFAVKDGYLYALVLGWPEDGRVKIKTLAKGSKYLPGEVRTVKMLGADVPLKFERTADALVVTMPSQDPMRLRMDYASRRMESKHRRDGNDHAAAVVMRTCRYVERGV